MTQRWDDVSETSALLQIENAAWKSHRNEPISAISCGILVHNQAKKQKFEGLLYLFYRNFASSRKVKGAVHYSNSAPTKRLQNSELIEGNVRNRRIGQ